MLYRVVIDVTCYKHIEVEAHNREEAYDIAEEMFMEDVGELKFEVPDSWSFGNEYIEVIE